MPKLAEESTTLRNRTARPSAPAAPPPASKPPAPPPAKPEDWEGQPAFRESFLLYFTDPWANDTLRNLGVLLHEFVLEFWSMWPSHPEGIFLASVRSALGDLRHVEALLREWTGPAFAMESSHEVRVAGVGSDVAESLGELADRLERALGAQRGEV